LLPIVVLWRLSSSWASRFNRVWLNRHSLDAIRLLPTSCFRKRSEELMGSFSESMKEYKRQLEKGAIQEAYQGLMEYFRDLRTNFRNAYPQYSVSRSIYYGYMDMTYFSLFTESLKRRKLKIAIVFVYDAFRFEIWLSGSNRKVQSKYWKLFKENDWKKYDLASNPKRVDYIIDHILVSDPDFGDLDALTRQIEGGTLEFIRDVERVLSKLDT
jgi:hypothetical protein